MGRPPSASSCARAARPRWLSARDRRAVGVAKPAAWSVARRGGVGEQRSARSSISAAALVADRRGGGAGSRVRCGQPSGRTIGSGAAASSDWPLGRWSAGARDGGLAWQWLQPPRNGRGARRHGWPRPAAHQCDSGSNARQHPSGQRQRVRAARIATWLRRAGVARASRHPRRPAHRHAAGDRAA